MSDARAIEAVTTTLMQVIDDAVNTGPQAFPGGVKVIAKPPHEVETDVEPLQVNLFLYRTEIDAALRNEDPLDVMPGETANPPLPLVLYYLITPYVQGGKDLDAHRLLGLASRAVNEQAMLTPALLSDASGAFSNVSTQLDRIRITWQVLAENDIYSLWSAFQTPYRLSSAFEVRAVLIDDRRPPRAPAPVLSRGESDRGPDVQSDITSPFPELAAAVPVNNQTAARLGESVQLVGGHLSAQAVTARFSHPLLADPVAIAAADITDTAVRVVLPDPPQGTPAGLWSVSLELTDTVGGQQVSTATNAVPLAIAPRITSAMPMNVARDAQGGIALALSCEPPVVAGQPVYLIVGSQAVAENRASTGDPVTGSALTFTVPAIQPGPYLLRLRVGGVDSVSVDRSQLPPRFDPSQSVTVTP
jgi:hypothetical protein